MKTCTRLLGALSLVFFSGVASAVPVTFTAVLSPANEVPPTASGGTGFVAVTFDLATNLMSVNANFSGLTTGTTASHIHAPAPPGVSAGVATQTPSFVGFPLGVTSGTFSNTLDMSLASSYNPSFVTAHGGTAAQAEIDLYNAMVGGLAYFNIHTTQFPGGEVRGNLAAVPDGGSTALLALPALLGLVALRRGRSRAA